MMSDEGPKKEKGWFQQFMDVIFSPTENIGIKLAPIEKSIMRQFGSNRKLRMDGIMMNIRYATKEDLENVVRPVLDGLVAKRFLVKDPGGWYGLVDGL